VTDNLKIITIVLITLKINVIILYNFLMTKFTIITYIG